MKKTILLCAAFLSLSFASVLVANAGEPVEYEATNCTFTGVSSDYCNASSGTKNVKVLECKPGTTDCVYEL